MTQFGPNNEFLVIAAIQFISICLLLKWYYFIYYPQTTTKLLRRKSVIKQSTGFSTNENGSFSVEDLISLKQKSDISIELPLVQYKDDMLQLPNELTIARIGPKRFDCSLELRRDLQTIEENIKSQLVGAEAADLVTPITIYLLWLRSIVRAYYDDSRWSRDRQAILILCQEILVHPGFQSKLALNNMKQETIYSGFAKDIAYFFGNDIQHMIPKFLSDILNFLANNNQCHSNNFRTFQHLLQILAAQMTDLGYISSVLQLFNSYIKTVHLSDDLLILIANVTTVICIVNGQSLSLKCHSEIESILTFELSQPNVGKRVARAFGNTFWKYKLSNSQLKLTE